MSELIRTTLRIADMHCTACALAIDLALEDLPGVREARTSFARSITEVRYDPRAVELPAIVAVIATAGYTATTMRP